jgi:hypothetical protein
MEVISKIYIDIECLLDIRQGILTLICEDEDKVINYLSSREYLLRTNDDFSSIVDMDAYNERLKKIDIEVIKRSTINYVYKSIQKKAYDLCTRNMYKEKNQAFELIVNMHNVQLTHSQKEAFLDGLFAKLKMPVAIRLVDMEISDLAPSFFKNDDVAFAYIYRFSEWLSEHVEHLELPKTPTDNILFFPSHIPDKKLFAENIDEYKKNGFDDPFNFIEMILSPYVVVNFLPSVLFNNTLLVNILLEKLAKETDGKSVEEIFNLI